MPEYRIPDLRPVLTARQFPTITVWNRLEGRPRTVDFERAMRAEVRDALWMLGKQWQMGELRGEDAGSPIEARLRRRTTPLATYSADGVAEPFDVVRPLESLVERKAVGVREGSLAVALDLRLAAGRRWLDLVSARMSRPFRDAYIALYAVEAPPAAESRVHAHPDAAQMYEAVVGRAMDGLRLFDHLETGGKASDGITGTPAEKGDLDALGPELTAWVDELLPPAEVTSAWDSSRLEYAFSCAAPGATAERTFEAEGFRGGHLDWYAFDAKEGATGVGALPAASTHAFVPVPVTFAGMPDTRYWSFEDKRATFGAVKPDTTDLAKLMLLEFALVYSNDWFLLPMTLDVGTVTDVLGLVVTDTFGDLHWIERAGASDPDSTKHFRMFELHKRGETDAGLLLLPTVPKVQTGPVREEVLFTRDEMANMVWAVERTIPLSSGAAVSGATAARETLAFVTALAGPPGAPGARPDAPLRYDVMTTVPEHWIPFVPVRVAADPNGREIQLQRGGLPRIVGGTTEKVRPRTSLLREGLEATGGPLPYFVHEEEIPRAGIVVRQGYRRTRGIDGRVSVWFGAEKRTGRGEGSSGLAFDRAVKVG